MANFKLVISEPETRKSFQLEVDQDKAAFVGRKIGDEFSGDMIGLAGYSLKITGGTDKDGFPMHPNVDGMGKRKVLLSCKPCFHPKLKGQRKRKTVRGNTISDSIVQINVKVIKKGKKLLEELIPTKPKEKKEEAKPEAENKPKEEKPVEKEAKKEGGEGSQKS
jgi:small subunit ribosomal protein S6e